MVSVISVVRYGRLRVSLAGAADPTQGLLCVCGVSVVCLLWGGIGANGVGQV